MTMSGTRLLKAIRGYLRFSVLPDHSGGRLGHVHVDQKDFLVSTWNLPCKQERVGSEHIVASGKGGSRVNTRPTHQSSALTSLCLIRTSNVYH